MKKVKSKDELLMQYIMKSIEDESVQNMIVIIDDLMKALFRTKQDLIDITLFKSGKHGSRS